MKKGKRKKASNNFIPYSKKLLKYSRWECWIMTIAIFALHIMGNDTGNLYQIVLTGWAGYGVAKALYYNMAKSDHQIQLLRQLDPCVDDKVKSIIEENLMDKLKEAIIQELNDTTEDSKDEEPKNDDTNEEKINNAN